MSIIKVEKNNYTVEPLYQWDLNQELSIHGLSLSRVPEVHFANMAMDRAIVRQATMDAAGVVKVDVPNALLQKPYPITAYICGYTGATFETYYKIEIPVTPRERPYDYTITDDPDVYSFIALENMVNNATQDMANASASLASAEKTLKDTVADIGGLVDETVEEKTDPKLEALEQDMVNLINGRARIVYGTYKGNGKYGASNPNNIPVDFEPMLVVIYKSVMGLPLGDSSTSTGSYDRTCNTLIMAKNATSVSPTTLDPTCYISPSWLENGVEWFINNVSSINTSRSAAFQFNEDGETYHYIVVGI